MTKAVQYDSYFDIDVLEVLDVPRPVPARGEFQDADRALEERHTHGKLILSLS